MVEACKTLDVDVEHLYYEIKTQLEFQDLVPPSFVCSDLPNFNEMLTKNLKKAAIEWRNIKKQLEKENTDKS